MAEDGLDLAKLRQMQAWIPYTRRADAAARVAAIVNQHLSKLNIVKSKYYDDFCIKNLRTLEPVGLVPMGRLLSTEKAAETAAYFANLPCYGAHVAAKSDGIARNPNGAAREFPFGSYLLDDIVRAPHILELANRPEILSVAEAYFGCVPTLYSMNAWWSFPQNDGAERITQMFHRDLDDFKFLALFVYLTDVDETNGPHQYVHGSHHPETIRHWLIEGGCATAEADELVAELFKGSGYNGRDLYPQYLSGRIVTINGPAGAAFLADPYGLHRGIAPARAPRLVCWIRYGLFENAASHEDRVSPVSRASVAGRLPNDPKSDYVNRLMVSEIGS
jgi:hypothetical protein